jgi:hypothetical protein
VPDSHADFKTIGRASCPFYAAFRIVSPMNAALPVEEAYRILTDERQNGHLVLLDAKAAFDKVIHSNLFRRMYHAGIQDKTVNFFSRI